MFKNYWKISWRNLLKKPFYTLINVLGLAIGMAVSLLILLYLEKEFSYDKYWEKSIFRLAIQYKTGKETRKIAAAEPNVVATFPKAFKEVTKITRVLPTEGTIIAYKTKNNYYNDIFFADSSFFDIFNHKVLKGSIKGVFENKEIPEIVLTNDLALEIFGKENPIGKKIQLRTTNAFSYDGSYIVRAIVANPYKTHFRFKALISWNHEDKFVGASWTYTYFTYQGDIKKIRKNWDDYYKNYLKRYFPNEEISLKPIIQPIESIHLESKLDSEIQPNGNENYLYLFFGISLLMITVACINFINISTVRSIQRIKEFGIRKMLGESKRGILIQLFIETTILVLGAFLVSLSFAELFFPLFKETLDQDLSFRTFYESRFVIFWLAVFLSLTVISGIYPIFYLTKIPALNAIKGIVEKKYYRLSFRKTLLVIQFAVTLVIMATTIMVLRQLIYLKSKDLGFDKKGVLVIRLPKNEEIVEKLESLKIRFMESPDIFKIANAAEMLGTSLISQFRFEVEQQGKYKEAVMGRMSVSTDFIDVMGLEIVEGSKFEEKEEQEYQPLIINEATAQYLKWTSPVGKKLIISRDEEGNPLVVGQVVGVVKNFHFSSLHSKISPLVLVQSNRIGNLFLSIAPKQKNEVVEYLREIWEEELPNEPFNYFLLNENYQKHYIAEETLAKLLVYFSSLMVLVASLGLLGLSLFISELRLKEIAIRKMLGAGKLSLIWLLSKDFVYLIFFANIIAIPVGYHLMSMWLRNFAYTAAIGSYIFIIAFLFTLFIALMPLFLQAILRVFVSPIKVLQVS
ncbi:MAG: ABC transporter permease [Raineya sp.]|jgi:putative ABC transport system permease protein|nr:ABC transporter permease [Raineya sp.]